jgi:ABC-type branched-subunit amino acid transport system substrate-binding protein
MVSRRLLLQSFAGAAAAAATGIRAAWAANAPGVTDAEIKIGQTFPYSGPASSYGVIARAHAAYFKMINEKGGINGRKLNLISVDDGYSAPKTVEQTRRLIEQEGVALTFQSFGGFTNLAVRPYLNENKVPQLFVAAGADQIDDPQNYPWTVAFNPSTTVEGRIYAKHILATKPDAKIGVLYQNDQLGKTILGGVRDGLGSEHAGALVKEVSYEVTDPTVDSQVITLQGAGVDTLIIAATSKPAAQAIRKVYDLGWTPERYLFFGSASIAQTLKPAGIEKCKGLITVGYLKDPTDPRWQDDPGFKEWEAFATKYMSPTDLREGLAVYGFTTAATMVHVLEQCRDDLSRENILRQALAIKDLELPMLLPGVKINTSPDNYFLIREFQLARFNGELWEPFGELISG